MPKIAVHHMGLASPDYEGTVDFYTRVMGWSIGWQDQYFDPDGKELARHVFFDAGDGLHLAFVCSVPGSTMFPEKWAADINSGLGLPTGVYHLSFSVESEEDLEAWRQRLEERGADVTSVVNHGWCKSIYFRDPVNDLMHEFCVQTRAFTADDKILKPRPQPGLGIDDPVEFARSARIMGIPVEAIHERAQLPTT